MALCAVFLFLFLSTMSSLPGRVLAQEPAAAPIPVAASIGPLGDFCRKIGGARVKVTVLIPPGASPHVFEPTPREVAQAVRAKVLVYVGGGLDPWVERLAASTAASQVKVAAVAGLPLLREASAEHGEGKASGPAGENHKHLPGTGNPHVWLDPVLAQDISRRIAAALIQADPDHREFYEANLKAFLQDLEALHQEAARRTAAFVIREFVSFHPSFSYFARRYSLKEVGVIEISPGREPTPGHIRRIVEAIKRYGVRVVFAEPQLSSRTAAVIAREAGVQVLLLDPLGGRPPYGDDYLRLMRYNLDIMEQAMK